MCTLKGLNKLNTKNQYLMQGVQFKISRSINTLNICLYICENQKTVEKEDDFKAKLKCI